MRVNKFSLLFIAGAVVVAAGLVAVQKKVDPSGETAQASASAGHQGHAMPSSASATWRMVRGPGTARWPASSR